MRCRDSQLPGATFPHSCWPDTALPRPAAPRWCRIGRRCAYCCSQVSARSRQPAQHADLPGACQRSTLTETLACRAGRLRPGLACWRRRRAGAAGDRFARSRRPDSPALPGSGRARRRRHGSRAARGRVGRPSRLATVGAYRFNHNPIPDPLFTRSRLAHVLLAACTQSCIPDGGPCLQRSASHAACTRARAAHVACSGPQRLTECALVCSVHAVWR